MPIIIVNDAFYHFEVRTSSSILSLMPLVLLHGFTGSAANWHEQTTRFALSMPCITIDLLGHGQTDVPANPTRYNMAQSAQDVVDLLEQVTPGPFNLLGYSMGGRLALFIAATYPQLINKLILESASPGLAEPTARQARVQSDEALANQIEAEGIVAFVNHWEAIPLFAGQQALPAATRQRLRDQRLRNQPTGSANSLRGMGSGVQPALWDQLASLTMPTLLLTGELDQKFCEIAQQMVRRLPVAAHVTFPAAGHTIHLEQPEPYYDVVSEFLQP